MEEAKKIWEAYIHAWNRHDIDGILSIVSDDFIYDERPMTMLKPLVGKTAFADYLSGVFKAFPILSIKILTCEASGKTAWSESIMWGKQTGRLGKFPASENPMVVRVACAFEVAGGKLIHERLYWDRANTLRQLGAFASVFGIFSQPVWKPNS